MAIFKCKMCGAPLNVSENTTVYACEYCGTTQTLPTSKNDVLTNLFNRANNLRMKNEFDKAQEIYEKIVNQNNSEAEAYWGIVLCKYGIEYVEDPATLKKIPTCHRTQLESVMTDVDYTSAIENANNEQKAVYEAEAIEIDRLQKDILNIVHREKPFDVFICYKETDENGKRTRDSVIANDIYHQLIQEGFKVFYAAITLEDKIGQEYEPYIFAALKSAKVMLVIGSKSEYFEAVWVKNEWSRFLKLMKNDSSKLLIPCYRDIDAYDLPEDFSHLQAQDMTKIGFINDLVRGIRKVISNDKPKATKQEAVIVNNAANANTVPLLKRAFIFLEDGDWNSANEYSEKVLDLDPENGEAYLVKLMAELNVKSRDSLKCVSEPFDEMKNYAKAYKYGSDELKAELDEDNRSIRIRNVNERKENIYQQACKKLKGSFKQQDYLNAKKSFESIIGYKDSVQKINECEEKSEICRKDAILLRAEQYAREDYESSLLMAIQQFEKVSGYKNADERAVFCRNRLAEIKAEKEWSEQNRIALVKWRRKKEKKYLIIAICVAIVLVISFTVLEIVVFPLAKYNKAVSLMEDGSYDEAISFFDELGDYKDSKDMIKKSQYKKGIKLFEDGSYDEAIKEFNSLDNYKDSKDKAIESKYRIAESLFENESYDEAREVFGVLVDYKDSKEKTAECSYRKALSLIENHSYDDAIYELKWLSDYKEYYDKIQEAIYNHAKQLYDKKIYTESAGLFSNIEYKDSKECFKEIIQKKLVSSVSCGKVHTAGLKSDGTVVSTGLNADGRCDGSGWNDIVAVSGGEYHTVGLKSDGTVVAVGRDYEGQCDVSRWNDIVAVSAGSSCTVGLKSDGTVVAVGYNKYDRCDVSGWNNIVAVSAGLWHTVGLKSDGTVVAVGYNDNGRCDVSEWNDIVAVSAGLRHTVGLKTDGTVVAVGDNEYGQCDVSGWKDIVAVSAGYTHTVGLKSDGTVVAVGDNNKSSCDVSGWNDIVAVSAGFYYTVGLKSDGTVVAAGSNSVGQCDVSEWSDIRTDKE